MPHLRISTTLVQGSNQPFRVRVHVIGARGGDDVAIRLWQTAGLPPFYSAVGGVTLDANGDGIVIFDDVRLAGPCTARIVADDDQSAVPLHLDDVHIEVQP